MAATNGMWALMTLLAYTATSLSPFNCSHLLAGRNIRRGKVIFSTTMFLLLIKNNHCASVNEALSWQHLSSVTQTKLCHYVSLSLVTGLKRCITVRNGSHWAVYKGCAPTYNDTLRRQNLCQHKQTTWVKMVILGVAQHYTFSCTAKPSSRHSNNHLCAESKPRHHPFLFIFQAVLHDSSLPDFNETCFKWKHGWICGTEEHILNMQLRNSSAAARIFSVAYE